jgi:hypothetical protein
MQVRGSVSLKSDEWGIVNPESGESADNGSPDCLKTFFPWWGDAFIIDYFTR